MDDYDIIKYLKSQGYEIVPITQTQEEQNYWNKKLGSQGQRQVDKLKKTLYLGLVSLLCLSMIGCSSKNTFKVGDIEFSNQDVERVESILTATSNYTDTNYLSDFQNIP